MTLNWGTNFLFPTLVTKSNIEITDNIVHQAMGFNEITDDLYEQVLEGFDHHLEQSLDKTTADWDHYKISSWINKYDKSHVGMEMHTHAGPHLSAIAIIESGLGGEIVFQDPRNFASRGYDMKFRPLFDSLVYQPEQGDLLVFPSFLYHGVRPVNQLRVSGAFDMYLYSANSPEPH